MEKQSSRDLVSLEESWKPNLFIVGTAKSGTTSLSELLSNESDVFLPHLKEPFYFVDGYGVKCLDEYRKLYSGQKEKYKIDASTGYIFDKGCAGKIKEFNPEAKIIIVLRNPISFVVSYWEYMRANGAESKDLFDSISEVEVSRRYSTEFMQSCEQWPASYWYLDRGLFSEQIGRYLNEYSKDKVFILLFEELIKGQGLKKLYEFIGLEPRDDLILPRANESGRARGFVKWLRFSRLLKKFKKILFIFLSPAIRYKIRNFLFRKSMTSSGYKKRVLSIDERQFLKSYFWNDVNKLKRLLPWIDFSKWKDFQ